MRIVNELKLDFSDVLISPKRSTLKSRADVDLTRQLKFKHSPHIYNGIPIMASNMDGVGTFSMALELQKHNMFTVIRKHYTKKEWDDAMKKGLSTDHIAVCAGTSLMYDPHAQDYKTLQAVANMYDLKYICIDVANGYQESFMDFVKRVRDEFPDQVIMAGNVVTPEATEELVLSGADIVKVGIGPGSACTTRIVTGVGCPQLSAIIECADAAHGLKGWVCADGGCTNPGDIAKAFGGNAAFVMLGGMLAAHKECEEQICNKKGDMMPMDLGFPPEQWQYGPPFVKFYGMSSDDAMEKHGTRKDGYRGAEGKAVLLPYKGPVEDTVEQILGGLRSACTYVGAERLKELSKRTTFVRCSQTHNTVFGDSSG